MILLDKTGSVGLRRSPIEFGGIYPTRRRRQWQTDRLAAAAAAFPVGQRQEWRNLERASERPRMRSEERRKWMDDELKMCQNGKKSHQGPRSERKDVAGKLETSATACRSLLVRWLFLWSKWIGSYWGITVHNSTVWGIDPALWSTSTKSTYCLAVGSTSWSFSSTFTSSLAASRYLSTFLMIFSASTWSLKWKEKIE